MKKCALNFLTLMLMMNFVGKPANAEILATDHIFAADSFWYKPIPVDVQLHDNSAALVAEFLRQKTAYYGTVGINTTAYASPVYYADADTPTIQVTQWDCQKKGYKDQQLAKQWSAVPVPNYVFAAEGSDGEMSIYQASTDTLWEFWKARKIDGQWQACWGGKLVNASKSDGIFPEYFGTTATSLPFIGGQITAEELLRGEIKHVIGIALVDLEQFKIFSWPAHRSDGHNPKNLPNRIPEGIRFRLDPSVNVDALKMHPVGKTIAKAAQKYGFVVWDKAGAITLRVQNPLSYTLQGQVNPYVELFDSTPQYAILKGMPWDRLQFLPMNYGKPLNLF